MKQIIKINDAFHKIEVLKRGKLTMGILELTNRALGNKLIKNFQEIETSQVRIRHGQVAGGLSIIVILGLFIIEDNLTITGFEASQYGQLIFAGCDNLDLSNIHITDSCSFGLTLHFCQHSNLENIICENQKVGFFFLHKRSLKTDNLLAKRCDVGFFLSSIFNSNMSGLFTLNNNIPFYISTIDYIANSTIEIEKETQLYLTKELGFERVYLNSSVSSFILSPQFIAPLDDEFFLIQINDTLTYRVVDSDFEHVNIDFIIKFRVPTAPMCCVTNLIFGISSGMIFKVFFAISLVGEIKLIIPVFFLCIVNQLCLPCAKFL